MAIYSDIDINLERQNDGDILRDTEIEAVKNSIINIINTRQGSRRMLPEFAVNIHSLLFEPMDDTTARMIGNSLFGAIETWDDRIIVENVNVHQNYPRNQYEVTVDFRIRTSQITETVSLILKQG